MVSVLMTVNNFSAQYNAEHFLPPENPS